MRMTAAVLIGLAGFTAACSSNPSPTATTPQAAPVAAPASVASAAPMTPAVTAAPASASAAAPAAVATGAVDMSGAWVATLDFQGQSMAVNMNLARGPNGYTGDAAPEGQSAAALSSLTIQGDRVTLTFSAPDGDAVFSGTLAPDRRAVAGTLAYNGQTMPFTMTKR